MKILLVISAIFEGLVGFGLLVMPAVVVSTLLNTPLDTPGGLLAARLAGAAIMSLAICCWRASGSERNGAALWVVMAMLFYNVSATAVLVYGGFRLGLQSVLIWPMVVLHSILTLWCGTILWLDMRRHEALRG